MFGRPKNRKKIEKIEKRAILEPKKERPTERTRPLAELEPSGYSGVQNSFTRRAILADAADTAPGRSAGRPAGRDGGRPAGRSAGRTPDRSSGRTVVPGERVVSGAEKKAFDRGSPVWPPRSNAKDNHLWVGTHPTMSFGPTPLPDQQEGRPNTKNCHELN